MMYPELYDIDFLRTEYVSLHQSTAEVASKIGCSAAAVWLALVRFKIPRHKAAPRNQKGENNNNWLGQSTDCKRTYHRRLEALYGKPKRCDRCGTEDPKCIYDWANLTGNYNDLTDYMRMCRSCHRKHDNAILNIKHMAK